MPTAQTSRYWCRCTTTRAPAPRAAASARQPNAGCRLWAWTTRAPVRRTAARDLVGRRPPRSSAGRRAGAPEQRRVAFEQLGVLAEVLADQPQQVLDGALLAPGVPVAVVQEQDHVGRKPRLSEQITVRASIIIPTRGAPAATSRSRSRPSRRRPAPPARR